MSAFWDWDEYAGIKAVNDTHRAFQKKVRNFIEKEIKPYVSDWEEVGEFPMDLYEKAYQAGVLGAMWPEAYGGTVPTAEQKDAYATFIMTDELSRAASGGLMASLFTHAIGLPPLLMVGTAEQKERYARDVITGKKRICLAITEASGGSDVANLLTTAVKKGDHYVVNGVKMFISGGTRADYFTTGVRTGGEGIGGVSLLLIDAHLPGVKVHRLKTQGWCCSSTCTVSFNDVKVPISNLLGEENAGFLPIMMNFSNERFGLAVQANRHARTCLEEAIAYAKTRKTFGKPLIKHQVLRHKLMEMARMVMATHALNMDLAARMNEGADVTGPVSLAKVQATKTFEFCAREASQIMGGRSYLKEGKGCVVERLYREVRVCAIGGGSEEIMLDLASRQAKL